MRLISGAVLLFLFYSCKTPVGIFDKKTGHEAYSDKIQKLGLQQTALGKKWFIASSTAITAPVPVQLPYKETGYFAADRPEAMAWSFATKRGEQLTIELSKIPLNGNWLFGDLFSSVNGTTRLIQSMDSTTNILRYTAKENANYIFRLQPELIQSGSYTIVIKAGPSLAFPVANPGPQNRIISYWGAGRDKGARKHEGVDIAGKFRTPVVAVGDGYVSSVSENKLGGKVVFVQSAQSNESWYYAHLDSQVAVSGQHVKTGDVVGLMGNTGNAKYTVTHLHFGIYTGGGAIDPLPFIQPDDKQPEAIKVPVGLLGKTMRVSARGATVFVAPKTPVPENAVNMPVRITAATGELYKIILPGGQVRFVAEKNLADIDILLKTIVIHVDKTITDEPAETAPVIRYVARGTKVNLLGSYGTFLYVKVGNVTGWMIE